MTVSLSTANKAGHVHSFHAPTCFHERAKTDSMPGAFMLGRLGAVWGIGGVILLLVYSIVRLSVITLDAFHYEFSWYHWLALGLNVVWMAYSEGYYGFQCGFAPRVAARAKYLAVHPSPLCALLAPVFCMGYFSIHRPRQIFVFVLTAMIVAFVLVIPYLAQPWRGIVDAGVVVGLLWGLITIVVFALQAFTSDNFSYSPEVPGYTPE